MTLTAAPTLVSARLTLGPATLAHAKAFMAFVTTDAARFIGGPASRDDGWDSVCAHAGQWLLRGYGTFWVSETATNAPVGRVGIFHPDRRAEAELSWVIYPAHEGKGYATEAARHARDWAYATLGLAPLMSLIDTANTASARVAEKLDATIEARHEPNGGKDILRWRHPGPKGRA
ncbi:MAG: hypothetical protein B7Z02_10235 [Rhodobacterales bacterium 32-67-9]|nr:MAG: hypothetical protein B7Z02_10235 [Rhodobacterales bacterium 32-67-9]